MLATAGHTRVRLSRFTLWTPFLILEDDAANLQGTLTFSGLNIIPFYRHQPAPLPAIGESGCAEEGSGTIPSTVAACGR
jgi:hypothetical protein